MTEEEFDAQVATGDVLVDFWASWCGPCQKVAPVMDAIAAKHGLPLVKVNVDDNHDLAQRFNLMSIPTIAIFRDGLLQTRVQGAYPQEAMEKRLGLS